MAARDARAIDRFASWCIHRSGWGWWWHTEVSLLALNYVGAMQLKKPDVLEWSGPVFDAFLAGAWVVYWTEDTIFWTAKPTVHMEKTADGRRFHNESYAALESDIENLYFWHGVLVPAFVVTKPEWITADMALKEENAEVRRVMIERMGMERFISESGAELIHRHERGELFSIDLPGDPERVLRSVRVKDPSTGREYFLRVPPTIKRADDAVAWTFGFDLAKNYRPVAES